LSAILRMATASAWPSTPITASSSPVSAIASRTISAFRKDVTQHMYGGDITRKMKLREKQKKGKKRMKTRGKISIPHDVFIKIMKPN
jgi:translation elongation factor EF-4